MNSESFKIWLSESYSHGQKYHGKIPEIKYLPVYTIKRRELDFRPEVMSVTDSVAKNMNYSEPIEVIAFRYGIDDDDQSPIVTLTDGHHRVAAAIQTKKTYLPVNVRAINCKGEKINALIQLSKEIESNYFK